MRVKLEFEFNPDPSKEKLFDALGADKETKEKIAKILGRLCDSTDSHVEMIIRVLESKELNDYEKFLALILVGIHIGFIHSGDIIATLVGNLARAFEAPFD